MTQILAHLHSLDQRRRDLGMSCSALARRAGVSLRTVQRVLSGREGDPGLATVMAMAAALGVEVKFVPQDLNKVRARQARLKADRILGLVQGTSALEAQAVADPAAVESMRSRTVRDLLGGSHRKLWAE